MNYRLFLLFSTLLLLTSCSEEFENEENVLIAGKDLKSITHVFYNYIYKEQPPTRTYTTNYSFEDNKINYINASVFNYSHEDPSKNYTRYEDSNLFYDEKNRLIMVEQKSYSDLDLTNKDSLTYEFDYYENKSIRSMNLKDGRGVLISKDLFIYKNDIIEKKYEYYDGGELIFYNETTYKIDSKQRIYHQTTKGPIFDSTDQNLLTENNIEAIFNEDGNVHQTFFDGQLLEEYNYTDIKIPSDLPDIYPTFFGYISFNILLAQFDGIVKSYNNNYLNKIFSLEPSNPSDTEFKNTLSKDKYPLRIEVFFDKKIQSETIYSYE